MIAGFHKAKRGARLILELKWRQLLSFLIDRRIAATPVPRLRDVQIEINSQCNRKCRLCPNSTNAREPGYLSEQLFHKIISDLKAIRFRGNICFNLFNEPTLDKRLPSFMSYISANLPSARIYLNTNGDFMTLRLWNQLRAAGLQYANITQYDGEMSGKIRMLLDSVSRKDMKRIYAHTLEPAEIKNWGGNITLDKPETLPLNRYCDRPFRQLCINYKGKAVLCCCDYFGEVEIGDVKSTSLDQLWKSSTLAHYRTLLLKGNRKDLRLCCTCSSK